jgi:RNA polymerase sigma factor (sigma-70 family)
VTQPIDVAALLADARAGRDAALSELVRRYTPVLWQVARQQGLDAAAAEDVVQTAWLRLSRSPETVRSAQALLGWLITVVRREAWRVADRRRRERPSEDDTFALRADTAPTPEQALVENDRNRTLWTLVAQLPPRCRELLRVVAFVPRPDYETVARALGMPVGSIGPTRGRCLAKLRALLSADPQWSVS